MLTNNHCALICANGNKCTAEFWNGSRYETANLKIRMYRKDYDIYNGTDWAILISDKESDFYKPVSPSTTPGQVLRGGFGMMRVIKDSEVDYIKNLYDNAMTNPVIKDKCKEAEKSGRQTFIECINGFVDAELTQMGKEPLFHDNNKFKIQTCNILGNHAQYPKTMVKTDCDSSGGDSGAPLLRDGQIVGLNNSGFQNVFGDIDENANGVKTENFYTDAQKVISEQSGNGNNNNTNNNNNTHNNNNNTNNTSNTNNNNTNNNNNNSNNTEQQWEQLLQQRLKDLDCD